MRWRKCNEDMSSTNCGISLCYGKQEVQICLTSPNIHWSFMKQRKILYNSTGNSTVAGKNAQAWSSLKHDLCCHLNFLHPKGSQGLVSYFVNFKVLLLKRGSSWPAIILSKIILFLYVPSYSLKQKPSPHPFPCWEEMTNCVGADIFRVAPQLVNTLHSVPRHFCSLDL